MLMVFIKVYSGWLGEVGWGGRGGVFSISVHWRDRALGYHARD
jgi:hypothetical protein